METWPIRFDTVKDMPGAMEVARSGQFVEYEDFERLLNYAARELAWDDEKIDRLKSSILHTLSKEEKNDR